MSLGCILQSVEILEGNDWPWSHITMSLTAIVCLL